MEICPMLYGSLDGKGVCERMDPCTCMAESLCSSPETITTLLINYQFSSVIQSCPTLCESMDCSTPGFPVHHQLPEVIQTHVHWVSDTIQPSHPLLSFSTPVFNLSHTRVFSNESVLHVRWSNYWTFSFSISTSNEYSGLISFRIDWLDLLAVQGTLQSILINYTSIQNF